MTEQKKVLKALIKEKGEREAFKSIMQSSMKAYQGKYPTMNIDTLTEQAWRFTIEFYKDMKVKLPEGITS
ncbi:hypothetical protein [Paenibacillus xylaniclasticus]|uniref:hypothetical protein n=1 Tax=Paenibacillus xylaniclasticus TaxID=588083 RepID=UPI000FD8CD36|nr:MULTISPECIES: hypothetical protein [Paenibacillus]GFN32556.1 hypothetical protein PCURB6_28160 [Paenibacillus curdlanolyticus]